MRPGGCPHARHRHDGSQSKIQQPWCRRRACGQPRGPRSCSQTPWCRPGRGRPAWARRSRHPAPGCPPPPVSASRVVPRVRVDTFRGERGCVGELPNTVVARTAVPDAGVRPFPRARPCRVPAQLSCGPHPPPDGDHRIVALHPTGRARPRVREASRASRRAPTESVDLRPGHRGTAAREALPAHSSTGGHARRSGEAGGRASPTDQREPRSKIAPTPPTRGAPSAMIRSSGCPRLSPRPPAPATPDQAREDRGYRLSTVAAAAMDNRHNGSCARATAGTGPPPAPNARDHEIALSY
jgi:hypothetical protein